MRAIFTIGTLAVVLALAPIGRAESKRHVHEPDDGIGPVFARVGDFLDHSDDIAPTRRWLGFYESSPGYVLRSIRIEVVARKDADSGAYLELAKNDLERYGRPIALFSGFARFVSGPIESVQLDHAAVAAHRRVEVSLRSHRRYAIHLHKPAPGTDRANLIVTSSRAKQVFPFFVNADPDGDRSHIRWIGDLDRDGRLDMMLSWRSSRDGETVLYLSADTSDHAKAVMTKAAKWSVTEGGP